LGERGIFEKIKSSNVGSNIVAALVFLHHSLISKIASLDTASACLLKPINTAKTVYRKFETNIPKNKSARPFSYIHCSVNDLYIPTIGLPILLQENREPILGIYV
jgi:hypothetical protein